MQSVILSDVWRNGLVLFTTVGFSGRLLACTLWQIRKWFYSMQTPQMFATIGYHSRSALAWKDQKRQILCDVKSE